MDRFAVPKTYAVWSKDQDIRYCSTSGGAFTEFAKAIIADGGLVAGAKYNDENLVEHDLIDSYEGIEKLRQSDYEAAKDFYVNKLGFSVIRENYRSERKDWKLDLRVNEHTELEIFAEENPPKRVNRPEACGLRHLAFCVESVEQTVRELAEVGIECEPIRVDDYTGKKMTFFHDPDGLPLELHE